MRSVEIDRRAVQQALEETRDVIGVDSPLDLRANAYGLGVDLVSELAHEMGFRYARMCPRHESQSALEPRPADASIEWLERAHRKKAQLLRGTIINLKSVPGGTAVSYGGRYVTPEDTTLALVTLGFADGLPRLDPVGGAMELAGEILPIAGRIAMDQCVVDIGTLSVGLGDQAVAWGGQVGIEQWSKWSGRSVPALSAGIAPRVAREIRVTHD